MTTLHVSSDDHNTSNNTDNKSNNKNEKKKLYKAGDVVETTFGVGVIVFVFKKKKNKNKNDDDDDDDESNSNNKEEEDDSYSVRLWRIPGKSIASACLATLRPQCILGKLPVAPGMLVRLKPKDDNDHKQEKEQQEEKDNNPNKNNNNNNSPPPPPPPRVLIHSYSSSQKTYLASYYSETSNNNNNNNSNSRNSQQTNDDSSFITIPLDQIDATTSSAPFYPVMESLMFRAEQTAIAVADHLKQMSNTQTVLSKTGKVLHEKILSSSSSSTPKLEDLASGIIIFPTNNNNNNKATNANLSNNTNVKQILEMVKNEELTVLLQKCKERLEVLTPSDISKATEEALEVLEQTAGIKINIPQEISTVISTTTTTTSDSNSFSSSSSFEKSMQVSRQAALTALQDFLLQQADLESNELTAVGEEITAHFTTAFDSLQQAAQSDRVVAELFQAVQEQTTEWQKATGRLLQTRSASLFLEGATRLQTRAAAIFGGNNNNMSKNATTNNLALNTMVSEMTKSFTEGDAALARLKSMELGQAVKTRLIEAIEVRSESLGGLDGIIAGALSNIGGGGSGSSAQQNIQNLLTNLQHTASLASSNAHETLISVLSSQSRYRDLALLRIEQTMCDLATQTQIIGEDALDPEHIAALVRGGEGGTAQIFEPIAAKAMQQIEKQLDAAEAQMVAALEAAAGGNNTNNSKNAVDANVLDALKRVRKLLSGELTISALMDEIVTLLNDDKVVAAGVLLVQQGEEVLDAIEGVSANQAVADALLLAEQAGITKDSLMRELDKLNVNELMSTAESAVTDEKARQKMLSDATDTALDFVLKILPSMPVPPFEGVKDGLVYHISNLSMKGFKVRKEDIHIQLAGMSATKREKKSKDIPKDVPTPDNYEEVDGEISNRIRTQSSDDMDIDMDNIPAAVKATELLIIDIRHISANLDHALWSFEQTYLPYLKGEGAADTKLSGGSIRLQFELRKQKKKKDPNATAAAATTTTVEWEPVLCLHDRTCTIAKVELALQGEGKLTWILNKLASIFKGPLRDYVVRTIIRVLSHQSGWILKRLNALLTPYWDLILRTANLSMDELVEADERVIVEEEEAPDRRHIELVWRERLPLGMNLLMNDESGMLKVVDFPRGSAARAVCEKRKLEPDLFKGAIIVAVNGFEYEDQTELFDALKDPARPKTIRFELAKSEEVERLLDFVEGKKRKENLAKKKAERSFNFRKVEFTEPSELGIEFESSIEHSALIVKGFMEGEGGILLAAAKSNNVKVGDLLTHINDECVVGLKGDDSRTRAIELLESVATKRPLSLTFVESYIHKVHIDKPPKDPGVDNDGGPAELILDSREIGGNRRIYIDDFKDANGMAENGGIFIGDHLVFVNGIPVGAGCRWLGTPDCPSITEVTDMLKTPEHYPIGLTFARHRMKNQNRWSGNPKEKLLTDETAETICVTAGSYERIGCVFQQTAHSEIVVADFVAVPGIFQRALSICKDEKGKMLKMSIEAVNGQFVPSYASVDMVKNAINRSWKTGSSIELVLCDDDLKGWLMSQLHQDGISESA